MNKIITYWNNAAIAFSEFKRNDLTWKYILLPELTRYIKKTKDCIVLDVGCGDGTMCKMLSRHAKHVTGLDCSEQMLKLAKEKCGNISNISFINTQIDCKNFRLKQKFDFIFCINVLVDLKNVSNAISNMSKLIAKGGILLFVIEHPFLTYKDVIKVKDARHSYFAETSYVSHFIGRKYPIMGWHRPLQTYFKCISQAGFILVNYIEPKSPVNVVGIRKYTSEPIFSIFEAKKV